MGLRRHLTLGALVLVAFSATPAAEATEPALVLPTCSAVVEGAAGTEVMVDPRALAEPIAGAAQGVNALGWVVEGIRAQWSAAPPIPVGTIGDGHLSGPRIADAAIARLAEVPAARTVLSGLAPVAHAALSAVCGIVTHVELPDVPHLPITAQPVLPPPADPSPPPAPQPRYVPESLADNGIGPGVVPRAEQRAPQEWPWLAGRRVVGDLEPRPGDPEMSVARTELTASRADSIPDEKPSWLLFAAAVLLAFAAGNSTRCWGGRG